jgi:hypothetical protein
MRHLLAQGFNSVSFLNLNVEDYVDYDLLPAGESVYSPDSLHRMRARIFCQALSDLADYAHQLHLQLFLQIYEFSLPDHLEGGQFSDDSARTWKFVDAKFSELLGETTLDGIIFTLTEPSPRLAYRGITLWKTPEGAGRMAAHYYETIVNKMHRRLMVRMWWVGDTMDTFQKVLAEAPNPDIMFDTKNTHGDFFLSVGENPLIPGGAARLRPFSVTFDVFRQFDGWGELIFYPAFWGQRFRSAKSNGAIAVNAWGPWDAGCIFPGSWVGKYDYYDFLQHGFRPALASLDLFTQLAWNPQASAHDIALDWGVRNVGRANAVPLAKALMLSSDLWERTYLGQDDHGVFKWAMLFQPRDPSQAPFFKSHSFAETESSNRQALSLASTIHELINAMQISKAPNPEAIREFRRAADLTLLYIRTFVAWREILWRNRDWDEGKHSADNRAALLVLTAHLQSLFPMWRQYPREANDWLVLQFDPNMNLAPAWLKRTTVVDIVAAIRKKVEGSR